MNEEMRKKYSRLCGRLNELTTLNTNIAKLSLYTLKCYDRTLEFPDFDSGKMYSGMEKNKEYTLDELGITYDD